MAADSSGDSVPHVYGTPSLVAFIEGTAHEALKSELVPGQTSVGAFIKLEHSSPTPIGMEVRCEVKLVSRDGIMAHFEAEAFDSGGRICTCSHSRAIVIKEKIEAKAQRKK